MKHVTLRQLKVFEAVARHLSFSRAADELHLTQPAVSMQVKGLEEMAGLPLTEQLGKKIFLTHAGAELARHSRLIAQQLAAAAEALDAIRDHAVVAQTLEDGLEQAEALMTQFAGLQIDMDWITACLLEEGVQAFADSFDKLLADIEAKRTRFQQVAAV